MNVPTDEQFERYLERALDELPREYVTNLNNVAITYADEPTPDQLAKLKIRKGGSLWGLYEGMPQTSRPYNALFRLPDKITLFKIPIARTCPTEEKLYAQIKRTLWHEIAHHYGLDHDRIHEIEKSMDV